MVIDTGSVPPPQTNSAASRRSDRHRTKPMTIDLDAYLERIDYDGARTPTLDTLHAVHLRHPQAIPFENLNPLLRWPVLLDAASLERKMVGDGRGGYCYEHNLLLSHALTTLGFRVSWLAARVMWNVPAGRVNARTHMLLVVHSGDTAYIADVGFGGLTLTAPLLLRTGIEQPTPHETFRLVPLTDDFVLEAHIGNVWKPLYRFGLQEQVLADYELASWYLSNNPESPFVKGVIAARVDGLSRYVLRDNELGIHRAGTTKRRRLTTAGELYSALVDLFHIRVPEGPELLTALDRRFRTETVGSL
jgi:N-hydroxyarylamine O-acetyltransferase